MPDTYTIGKWKLTDYVDHCMLSDGYHAPERYTPAQAALAVGAIEDEDKLAALTEWMAKVEEEG